MFCACSSYKSINQSSITKANTRLWFLFSRTLSPMNSFSSELGVQFGTCLEAPHVVDVESQVWLPHPFVFCCYSWFHFQVQAINFLLQVCVSVISTSPDNYPLNASYKTADCYAFQVPCAFYHWSLMIQSEFLSIY
jgi:hypothetical protein